MYVDMRNSRCNLEDFDIPWWYFLAPTVFFFFSNISTNTGCSLYGPLFARVVDLPTRFSVECCWIERNDVTRWVRGCPF